MRCLECDKRQMWLSRPEQAELVDEASGLPTGEVVTQWSRPVGIRINAAPPTGTASPSPFGTEVSYDLALVADAGSCDVREGDRMWLCEEEPDPAATTSAYVVVRVGPSIHYTAYALRRVQGQ